MQAFRLEQLLRQAAAAHPHGVAVRDGNAQVTWRELGEMADHVQTALADLGVGVGDRVGLYLEKGIHAVAALYGVMLAGAIYVPIDPDSPLRRAAVIAADCEIAALIADVDRARALRDAAPDTVKQGLVVGGAVEGFLGWDVAMAMPRRAVAPVGVETDLAYILYTSGSTGRPKGVAITHRNALTFITWAVDVLALRSDDVLASHAPLHFDLSTLDFFAAAAAGASTAIVPRREAMFPVALARWMGLTGITVWYSVPTALALLVRFGDLSSNPLPDLRLVLFAGEVFPAPALAELMRLVPQARYVNLFGPTETNVCTAYEVNAPPDPHGFLPIGRGCANNRCEVIDEDGISRRDVGARGELVVTGPGVARGYWGDEERTRAVFVGRNSYRTGDVVQILEGGPDPLLKFLGRRDNLVKTRGYRVELGEVEAALYTHPAVREAVAVAVPDAAMGNRLVAFCAPDEGLEETSLRAACLELLPTYMVPSRFVPLPRLPTTPNGKYDRRSLTETAVTMMGERA
jgi:amino acid adenylation domain-containing protein